MGGRAWRAACGAALGVAIGGCFAHQDVAMRGNANSIAINYVGDIAETLPIARQHCAQFEREPVLRGTKENTAYYVCLRVNGAP
jgi:hypothetical protein